MRKIIAIQKNASINIFTMTKNRQITGKTTKEMKFFIEDREFDYGDFDYGDFDIGRCTVS